MTRNDVIQIFGGATAAARAMGLKSRQAIYAWPDELSASHVDRVIGAAIRSGLADKLPKDLLNGQVEVVGQPA